MKYYDKRHTVEAMQWDGWNTSEVGGWIAAKLGIQVSCEQSARFETTRGALSPAPEWQLTISTPGWKLVAREGEYITIHWNRMIQVVPRGTFAKVYEEIG